MGLNRKASWRKEKIPRVLCFSHLVKNLIRGDNGDFVCVLTFPPSSHTPPLLCPSFVISMGKLGNVIITEKYCGSVEARGRGPVPGSAGGLFF